MDLVVEGRLDVHQARNHLEDILVSPPRFGPWRVAGAYGLAAFGMARVLGGGWREMLLGTLVGLLVGSMLLGLQRSQHPRPAVPPGRGPHQCPR